MTRDSKELLEVEEPFMRVLTKNLGWTELKAEEADGLRPSQKEPILTEILKKKIKDLNEWISDENINRVISGITGIQAISVLEANEKIQTMLEKGTTAKQDLNDGMGLKSRDVKLIDYESVENNDFSAVRQFRVRHYAECKPDVVLFVNGMPIAVIECKSPTEKDAVNGGRIQLVRYQEARDEYRNAGCPRLFNTVQIVASTCRDRLKYATNFTAERHWSEWKEPYPSTLDDLKNELGSAPYLQEIFIFGVLRKENLLDIIRNYAVYEREDGKIVKKICKYQQFRAVSKIVKKALKKQTNRGGVVWHTQGSGKSLSMLWTAVKLRRAEKFENPAIVVVTDRTDLDDQITGTFIRCGFPNPVQTKSSRHLQEALRNPVGQTIMTTIQKFQDAADEYPTLSESRNVFVLVDEAHRTQYKSLAANMRKAIPFATFIGFTGTPISKKNKSTTEVFGDYVDTYNHRQAVRDGATVEILYEGRMPELSLEGEPIDETFDRKFSDYSQKEKETIKRKSATPEEIAMLDKRIKKICENITGHFKEYVQPNGFKAQIVASSRRAAIKYKKTLDELKAPPSEVLISKNHNDESEFSEYHKSKTAEQEVIRQFKEEKDPQIIIVCDKLLTGFDAPVEQVMYLDSPLKEHRLLQAIARVNRINRNKRHGMVIDYWGVSGYIQEALDMFSPGESEGLINTEYKKDALRNLQEAHNAAMNFFRDAGGDVEKCVQLLEPEDERAVFDSRFKRFADCMDLLLPDPAAQPYLKDFKRLDEIRKRARNRYGNDRRSLRECSPKVRKIIDKHIKAEGITTIIEPVSIFDKKFDEHLEKLGSDRARASEMAHALKRELDIRLRKDPVYYETLREKLGKILQALREGRIDEARQMKILMEIREDVENPERHADVEGIEAEDLPFYRLLAKDGGEKMKEPAAEIRKKMVDLAVVDWQAKEDIKRQMRKHAKRILRAAGYPREKTEHAAHKIVDLAGARIRR